MLSPESGSTRRRRYIVTFVKQRGETDASCDLRLLRRLGVDPDTDSSDVTVTAYEPATNGFRSIVPPPA
jgi:hypothetical protein